MKIKVSCMRVDFFLFMSLRVLIFISFLLMNFFKRLFSCGSGELADETPSYLPSLCFQKQNRTSTYHRDPNNMSSPIKSKTISLSTHMEVKSQTPAKIMKLPTKIMQSQETKAAKLQTFDIGFLIGTINGVRLTPLFGQFLKKKFVIQIQKQLNDVKSLRPYSLDFLIVYWGEFGCNFYLRDVLLAQQKLMIVAEDWETAKLVVLACDSELKNMAEQIKLNRLKHRIWYNIIKTENFFVVQFKEYAGLEDELKSMLPSLSKELMKPEHLASLASVITLQDYIQLIKQDHYQIQKVSKLLVIMQYDRVLAALDSDRASAQQPEIVQVQQIPRQKNIQKEVPAPKKMDVKDNKTQSDCEEQIKYFSPKKNIEENPHQFPKQAIIQQLDILNYGDQETVENLQTLADQPKITLNLVKFIQKKRSRSQSFTPEQITYSFDDDEMYDKYQ